MGVTVSALGAGEETGTNAGELYNIIDEQDLARAVARRFNGKATANTGAPAVPSASVTSTRNTT